MADLFGRGTPASQLYPCVPPKVAAAQEYLRFAEQLRTPVARFDGAAAEGRDLTKSEQVAYDAALEVLRSYFTGEQEYAPAAEAAPPLGGDDPTDRIPVTP